MKQSPYGPEAFAKDTGVSRETLDRLRAYAALLVTWNKKINLVGKSTEAELWHRHLLDSAQLFRLTPKTTRSLVDLGSGAGFPGLVLAIMGVAGVTLVESDQRKAAFLREAARVAGAQITVHARRIEEIAPFPADVITARALAPVADLLGFAEPFLQKATRCLFLKGQNVASELTDAHKRWSIRVTQTPSLTDSHAAVLCIQEVSRVASGSQSGPNQNPPPDPRDL